MAQTGGICLSASVCRQQMLPVTRKVSSTNSVMTLLLIELRYIVSLLAETPAFGPKMTFHHMLKRIYC